MSFATRRARAPRLARPVAVGAAALALTLAVPLTAQAHVRVDPGQATAGSYTVLTFRVPTESPTASTTKVVVDLPTDHPFSSLSYQPVPGWTAKVVTTKLDKPVETKAGATITEAPTQVIWTAESGHAVAPGQFQEFSVSAGPVPDDVTSLELPAHQTYSDGSVVDWDEATPASGEEPEHPAPVLQVVPASTADPSATAAASSDDSDDGGSGLAVGLGVAGLVLGAVGLGAAVVALRRTRRVAA
ncbi:YcnI family protein [Luteimicrobium sp. NPDC057192]|uniref:YcnI family copper-binding membrane protein n=1 Tax=Luteimicrobium sp. NPDC057192 TaxID=3346042 RepID=UPI003640020D